MNEQEKAEDLIKYLKTVQVIKYTDDPTYLALQNEIGDSIIKFIEACELEHSQVTGLLNLTLANFGAKILNNRYEEEEWGNVAYLMSKLISVAANLIKDRYK